MVCRQCCCPFLYIHIISPEITLRSLPSSGLCMTSDYFLNLWIKFWAPSFPLDLLPSVLLSSWAPSVTLLPQFFRFLSLHTSNLGSSTSSFRTFWLRDISQPPALPDYLEIPLAIIQLYILLITYLLNYPIFFLLSRPLYFFWGKRKEGKRKEGQSPNLYRKQFFSFWRVSWKWLEWK